MKFSLAFSTILLFALTGRAQQITWSSSTTDPKGNNPRSLLLFPGKTGPGYYVLEEDVGDAVLRKKVFNYIQEVDIPALKVKSDINFNPVVPDAKGKDYYQGAYFVFKDKVYAFYIDDDDKDIYNVYATVQKIKDGESIRPFESIQKVDIRASEEIDLGYIGISMAKDKKRIHSMDAAGSVLIKPTYDEKSIISAMITNVLDKDNSMLTITEWDENLRVIKSTDHKIPFRPYTPKQKYLHRDPKVWDVVKDKNGFVYVHLRSGNPKDEDDDNLDWIYQFKISDPSYMKFFKKELSKGFGIIRLSIDQDASGKVFISSVGNEGDDNKEKYFVNAALIGSFNDAGQLETIFANQLTDEMMYNFSSEKKVGKKGGVNTLRIRNILPTSNGGCYVIWQYEWTEIKDNYRGDSKSKFIDDNVLVQYFNKDKKIVWEKPIYKHQVTKDNISGSYSGFSAFVVNDDLHVFYPDDKKNAGKSADDKDVATFSVVQFGDRDLSGIFSLTYKMNGSVERNYVNWTDDKVGYAFLVNSMKYIGNNQFIGTARKIKQGALFLKAEQYAFFKLAF